MELHLEENRLESLPTPFKLTSLSKLYLDNNQLSTLVSTDPVPSSPPDSGPQPEEGSIPSFGKALEKLSVLSLHSNKFSTIESIKPLKELKNLYRLTLDHNPLPALAAEFIGYHGSMALLQQGDEALAKMEDGTFSVNSDNSNGDGYKQLRFARRSATYSQPQPVSPSFTSSNGQNNSDNNNSISNDSNPTPNISPLPASSASPNTSPGKDGILKQALRWSFRRSRTITQSQKSKISGMTGSSGNNNGEEDGFTVSNPDKVPSAPIPSEVDFEQFKDSFEDVLVRHYQSIYILIVDSIP